MNPSLLSGPPARLPASRGRLRFLSGCRLRFLPGFGSRFGSGFGPGFGPGLPALALLATLLLPWVAALAAGAGTAAALPACCRAHGRHHCAMGAYAQGAPGGGREGAQLGERCPYLPQAQRALAALALPAPPPARSAELLPAESSVPRQPSAPARPPSRSANLERGPPRG